MDDNREYNREYTERTLFSGSIATLMRIDSLLKSVSQYYVNVHTGSNGKYFIAYYHAIIELWKELYPFLNEKEKTEGQGFVTNIKKNKYEVYNRRLSASGELVSSLYDFDLWIRSKLLDYGLLMTRADDPRRSLK